MENEGQTWKASCFRTSKSAAPSSLFFNIGSLVISPPAPASGAGRGLSSMLSSKYLVDSGDCNCGTKGGFWRWRVAKSISLNQG